MCYSYMNYIFYGRIGIPIIHRANQLHDAIFSRAGVRGRLICYGVRSHRRLFVYFCSGIPKVDLIRDFGRDRLTIVVIQ